MPDWAKNLQYRSPDGNQYYVGVFSDAPTREEALERSWLNTLISIARVEFPFLQTIKQFSVETLSGAEYRREAALAIERVKFEGVTEAQEKGSPHIVAKVVNGKEVFTAYRLLKWSKGGVTAEAARLKAEAKATAAPSTSYDSQIGAPGKATGQLKIQTQPAGAQILLDGEPLGRSNASFSKVSEGSYKLILQREGYETVEKQIIIQAAQTHTEEITFKKLQGTATVESTPSGALVFVDNVPLGRTPTVVKREFGTGTLRVELEDYFSETREMSFSHIPTNHDFDLRPKQGKISILSTPSGATVSVDGVEVGKTPWLGKMLEGGQHTITLSYDQFEDWSQEVFIKSSKSISLAPTLVARRQQPMFAAESHRIKSNPLKLMAPKGKWIAGGVSIFAYLAATIIQNTADDAYDEYRSATSVEQIVNARDSAEKYDSSASSLKTIATISGLACIGFVLLDCGGDDQNEYESDEYTLNIPNRKNGTISITAMPKISKDLPIQYALSLRFKQ